MLAPFIPTVGGTFGMSFGRDLNLPRANKRAIMETSMEHLKRTPTAGLLQARMADAFINVASVQDPKLFADVP